MDVSPRSLSVTEFRRAGYRVLPYGTTRTVRVNQDFVRTGDGKPLILHDGPACEFLDDVRILGASRLVYDEVVRDGVLRRSVWIETEAGLAVR